MILENREFATCEPCYYFYVEKKVHSKKNNFRREKNDSFPLLYEWEANIPKALYFPIYFALSVKYGSFG